ncbi:hypothetical protein L0Y41_03515, partial [bacterium]|nr:hypothetical protein [bacterium]
MESESKEMQKQIDRMVLERNIHSIVRACIWIYGIESGKLENFRSELSDLVGRAADEIENKNTPLQFDVENLDRDQDYKRYRMMNYDSEKESKRNGVLDVLS